MKRTSYLWNEEIQELERLADELRILSCDLDEFVHDQKASEATIINNGDLPSQLSYLCHSWGRNAVVALLRRLGERD